MSVEQIGLTGDKKSSVQNIDIRIIRARKSGKYHWICKTPYDTWVRPSDKEWESFEEAFREAHYFYAHVSDDVYNYKLCGRYPIPQCIPDL